MWSADPNLAGGASLKINGIAFDGHRTLYTANYSTGELFAVRIGPGGSAEPAEPIPLDTPMTNPDGIRWHAVTYTSPRTRTGSHASTRAQEQER